MRWYPFDAVTGATLIRSYRRVFRWRSYAVLIVRTDPFDAPGGAGEAQEG